MNNYKKVVNGFNELKKKGWLKTNSDGEDYFYFPFVEDINVLCTTTSNIYPIILFSFEHNLDEKYLDFHKFFYQTKYNRFNNSIDLFISNYNNQIIYQKSICLIYDLKDNLLKLYSILALIYIETMKINKNNYYKYSYLKIYRCKGFDTFLNLINKKIIIIDINNKNVVFKIAKKDINKLFKTEYSDDGTLQKFLTFLD